MLAKMLQRELFLYRKNGIFKTETIITCVGQRSNLNIRETYDVPFSKAKLLSSLIVIKCRSKGDQFEGDFL